MNATVLDPGGSGAPAVGATVVFLDPDGTVVKRVATDAMGKASADVLPGASVTAVTLVNTQYLLQTVLAVKPGDDLIIGTRTADSSAAGDFTVTYPAFSGATSYTVVTPCFATTFAAPASGAAPAPATFTLSNSCKLDTMEIVVVAQNANGLLSSVSKAGVPFVAGGATTVAGPYQGLRNFTGSYTNINPIITNLDMTRWIPDPFGFVNDQPMASPGTTAVLNVTGPLASGGQIVTQANTSTGSVQVVRQTVSGMAATYGFDVGATLLPWIKQPTYDAANNKIIVPLDTTGTTTAHPDLFRLVLSYRRVDANNVSHLVSWTIFGPDAADIVVPILPPELGGIGPTPTDSVAVTSARMFEADTVTSYDMIRNDVNKAVQQYTSSRPPASTVRLSAAPSQRIP